MKQDVPTFNIGSKIGSYLILDKLGEGGMAEVFKAIEPALERYVAIKIMLRSNMQSSEGLANFLEEARAIAGLRHANIVPLYSAGDEQGVPYLAMGYIEGTTLEDWLLRGRSLTVDEIPWFMTQAVAALDYASRAHIIHLDVKPANFMVDADNVLMLTDFGLARKMSAIHDGLHDGQELQGTPAYASPEHIMQEKPDLRTDIYCLGATLFHLVTCEFPYPAETTEEACRLHIYAPFPIEVLQKHNIPQGWINIIRKMMEKKPEERFQSYQELTDACQNVHHFQHGKKSLSLSDAGERRALPRTGGMPDNMFDMIPDEVANTGEYIFTLGQPLTEASVYETLNSRWSILALNHLADELRAMQQPGSEDIRELMAALAHISSYKETLEDVSGFMANASDSRPQSDAEKIELVGLDRSRNLALTAIALYRPWQGERPFNCHHLWQHMIYTGIITEFIVDMLGLPTTGLEFLAGVTHDIGKLVLLELYPAKTLAVWMQAYEKNIPLAQAERDYFSVDHAQIGLEWLKRNKFDPQICYLTAYHDHPESCYSALMESGTVGIIASMRIKEKSVNRLADLIFSANLLTKELGLGYSGNPYLSSTTWGEHPITQRLFEQREKEDVTWEDFLHFFTVTCQELPEIAFMKLTHATEAQARRREQKNREKKQQAENKNKA